MAGLMQIQCPNGHMLTMDTQHVGKRVVCPSCRVVMTVPAYLAAPPPIRTPPPVQRPPSKPAARVPVDEDEDDEEEDDEDDPGLQHIRTGLSCQVGKVYVMLCGGGFFVFLTFIFVINAALGREELIALRVLAGGLMLTGVVLDLLTFFFLLAGPPTLEGRPLVFGFFTVEVVSYAFSVAAQVLPFSFRQRSLMVGLASLAGIAGYLCCIEFLKRLASDLGRKKLTESATILNMLISITLFFDLILVIGMVLIGDPNAPDANPDPPGIAFFVFGMLGVLVIGTWAGIRYLRLLRNFRAAL